MTRVTVAVWSSLVISISCPSAERHVLVEKILEDDPSAFLELELLSDEEKFDALFSSYYTTQTTNVWRVEQPDLVNKIRENLNRNPYLKQGLMVEFEKAMKPQNGRQRELLFQIVGTLNRDVVTHFIAKFLSDQRRFEHSELGTGPNPYLFEPANSYLAARTLGGMRIADPPTRKDPLTYREAEVKAWQDWWSEVTGGEIEFDVENEIYGNSKVSVKSPHGTPADMNSGSDFPTNPNKTSESEPSVWLYVIVASAIVGLRVLFLRQGGAGKS